MLLSLALLAASQAISNTPPGLSLDWVAPEGCATANEVVAAVMHLVSARGPALEASVRVTSEPSGFTAELALGAGQRTLVGASCSEVTEAVVVILALAIDPDAPVETGALLQGPLRTGPTSAPKRAPPRPRRPTSRPSKIPHGTASDARTPELERRALRVAGFARLTGELGMLPGATLGAALGLRLGAPRWFGELGALGLLPRSGERDEDPTEGGDFSFLGAELAFCATPGAQVLLLGCLGLEAGRLTGVGFRGAETLDTGQALWLAPALRALLRQRLSTHTAFEVTLGASIPLLGPSFGLGADQRVVHTPHWLSGRLAVGLSVF